VTAELRKASSDDVDAAFEALMDRTVGLRELVAEEAPKSEAGRTLSQPIVDALWSTGLMQCLNPVEAGGLGLRFEQIVDLWQELAWQDASLGWIGIANLPSSGFAAAYLEDEGFDEVFTRNDHRVTVAGQFAPNGRGEAVDGGYRLEGQWNFGSGTGHSEYVVGGFMPTVDGVPRIAENGLPEMRVALMPRADVRFTDGWHVQGLKGTGSYDYECRDVFVPIHRTFELFTRERKRGGPLFDLGVMPLTGAGHAAWALGVARAALDDLVALAQSKVRMGDMTTLAHKPTFQRNLAHHEGMWRAARRLVWDTCKELGDSISAGEPLTQQQRTDVRLAATYATEACREVVTFAHLAAGTSSIREGSRLERGFRDMLTGTQHAFISEKIYIDVGELLVGVKDENFSL
jgi:alkylation response protein AidB-like acyl-CoA dehydrogenase